MSNENNKIAKTSYDLQFIKSAFERDNDLSYKVFNEMPIGICITNQEGFFTDVNDAYCEIYKYDRSELIGKEFIMVVPKNERPILNQLHQDFIQNKFELRGRWTVRDKKGHKFDIVTNAAYLKGEIDRKPRKMTLVVRAKDIDDTLNKLRSTLEILERKIIAQENARELAEHDMRNNIGAIMSITSILESSELTQGQLKWIRMIKNIGAETLELLEASNGYAKMEMGNYKPKFEEFDMLKAIMDEMDEIVEKNSQKTVAVQFNLDGNAITNNNEKLMVNADLFYIKRLFRNILNNAIEASPTNSTILIDIQQKNGFSIEVMNQGMIPQELKENFFEKYTTSGKEKGTGLGTYIAKLITENHGGNISFKTNTNDETIIIIDLPKKLLNTSLN